MKSKIEEYCKSEFQDYLESTTQVTQIKWEEDEPPDYYLYMDGKKYAVEVSTLVQRFRIGELTLSRIGVVASLWDLVDEVERTAEKEATLNGTYVVRFSRPITDFGTVRDQLFQQLLSYMRRTRQHASARERVVFEQGKQRCTIEKLHNQRSHVGKIGPSDAKWEVEITEEVCSLLQERIDTKHDKLRDISDPKVLLLYDAYQLATPKAYQSCLDDLTHLDEFHTVFIAGEGRPRWVLHSKNSGWIC